MATKAADAAQHVDWEHSSNLARNAHWNAMRNGWSGESVDDAESKTNKWIDDNLRECDAKGLGIVLHAGQDKHAGGHEKYKRWYDQPVPGPIHILKDTFLSDRPGAVNESLQLIKKFKEMCPCACGK